MAKTSNVFARVEPEIKEQAESVLNQLGIPMSNAIGLFLNQIVLQNGIPFEIRLPVKKPVSLGSLSKDELNAELSKGFEDVKAGRTTSAKAFSEELQRDYGI